MNGFKCSDVSIAFADHFKSVYSNSDNRPVAKQEPSTAWIIPTFRVPNFSSFRSRTPCSRGLSD